MSTGAVGALTDHITRDAGAAARSEIRLIVGLLDRRLNALAKAKIAAQNLSGVAGGGTEAGRSAARDALLEVAGTTFEQLEAGLNGQTEVGVAPEPPAIES